MKVDAAGYESEIATSPRPRIVHSFSPRKEFLRRLVLGTVVLVTLALTVVGGLFAVRSLEAEPAPKIPKPERVVKVNVQPER